MATSRSREQSEQCWPEWRELNAVTDMRTWNGEHKTGQVRYYGCRHTSGTDMLVLAQPRTCAFTSGFFSYPDMKTSRPEYHTESDGYIRTRSQVRVQQGVTIILRLCTLRRKGIVLHASKQAFSHALYSFIVTYSYVFTSRDAVRIPNFLVLTFPIIFLLFTFPVVFS